MFEDPDFTQAWVDRWQQLRQNEFSDRNIASIIDGMAAEIEEAQARNFVRWREAPPMGGELAEPGLTGWAQVSADYGDSVEGQLKKLEYELFYIHDYSLMLDAVIVLKTIQKVLSAKGQ